MSTKNSLHIPALILIFLTLSGSSLPNKINECPKPILKMYHDEEVLDVKETAIYEKIKLVLSEEKRCADITGYEVEQGQVVLARGLMAIRKLTFSGSEIDLSDWMTVYRAGDRLVVEVKKATVINSKGERSDYPYSIFTAAYLK